MLNLVRPPAQSGATSYYDYSQPGMQSISQTGGGWTDGQTELELRERESDDLRMSHTPNGLNWLHKGWSIVSCVFSLQDLLRPYFGFG